MKKEIFTTVCETIANSTGIEQESIEAEQTLFDYLGIDSIDMVDILFELETHYDIELKISDIQLSAVKELGDLAYQKDGVITKEGLSSLKKNLTEIDTSKLVEGITIRDLSRLFNVGSLCKIVEEKLAEKQ